MSNSSHHPPQPSQPVTPQSPDQPATNQQTAQHSSTQTPQPTSDQHHPIGHHKPQPVTPDPSQHHQHHPYTHSSHTYQVEERNEVESARKTWLKKHKVLSSLVVTLLILSTILDGLLQAEQIGELILRRLNGNQETLLTEARSGVFSEAVLSLNNAVLFSNSQGVWAYLVDNKHLMQLEDQTLKSLLVPGTQILTSPDKRFWLIYGLQENSPITIIDLEENQTINFGRQISENISAYRVKDVIWHPQENTLLTIVTIDQLNLEVPMLVQYSLASKQFKRTQLQTGNDPIISWIHPNNQSVYITSRISNQTHLLTIVDRQERQQNQRTSVQLFGRASQLGTVIGQHGIEYAITDLQKLSQPQAYLVIDPALGPVSQTIWQNAQSQVSVIIQPDTYLSLFTAQATGSTSCSLGVEGVIHKQSAPFYYPSTLFIVSEQEKHLLQISRCQLEKLPVLDQTPITHVHGWI